MWAVWALAIALGAIAIDVIIGEPPSIVHPVVWKGRLVSAMDGLIARKGVVHDRVLGAIMAIAVVTVSIIACGLVLGLARSFSVILWAVIAAYSLKCAFALYSLRRHVAPVRAALEDDDLPSARAAVGMIVSRDTSDMDGGHIASCAVESVSENMVDSVVSPWMFLGIGGIPAAAGMRASNVLDAMVGYRKPRHLHVGWFSARLDDAVNYVPARVSVPFIVLASAILGFDWRGSIDHVRRYRHATPSPNSGWSMSAVAGALGVTMHKPGTYTIGDGPMPDHGSIYDALLLVELSSILFILLVAVPLFIYLGIFIQLWFEGVLTGLIGV